MAKIKFQASTDSLNLLGPLLIMDNVIVFIVFWFIPWFFTILRFSLALWQGLNRPYLAWMGFRFIYLPGPMLSNGWIQFFAVVFLFALGVFYWRLKSNSPDAIKDFQKMDLVSFLGFYTAMYTLMAMLWLPWY